MGRAGWWVAALVLAVGCDDGDGGSGQEAVSDAGVVDARVAVADAMVPDAEYPTLPPTGIDLDALPTPPAPGEWLEIAPGGNTICSRGTEYRFYVRGGDPSKVIVDFQGGGACWNALTCSVADALFSDRVAGLESYRAFIESGLAGSMFSTSPDNPFADWTLVHVPYCTGDIHWGDAVVEYAAGTTIRHNGMVNARAAVEWVQRHRPTPERVFVTGCSAGAYGAIVHSAFIADHYRDAQVAVLADSGAGIITASFLLDSLPNWNAQANLPPFVDGLQGPLAELSMTDVYANIANTFPQHRFAQTAAAYDADQIFYFTAMGGQRHDWNGLFRASLAEIGERAPNFRSYVPAGSMHCGLIYPFYATREVGGVRLADWTEQLALGETPPASVACEGEGCFDDAVCAACAEGGEYAGERFCGFCAGWPDDFRPPME